MIDWTTVIVVAIVSVSLGFIGVFGVIALRHIGEGAFRSGSAPGSADSFVNFFLQSARIAIVAVIVIATVVLALTNNLSQGRLEFSVALRVTSWAASIDQIGLSDPLPPLRVRLEPVLPAVPTDTQRRQEVDIQSGGSV